MRRYIPAVVIGVLLLMTSFSAYPASLGLGIGIDPTGLILFNVASEAEFGDVISLRAQMGFSTLNVEGLMLIGGMILVHYPVEFVDPFAGIGIGAAVTKARGSALTLEGGLGSHITLFGPLQAFIDVRYIARFTSYGIDTGPLYESGLSVFF